MTLETIAALYIALSTSLLGAILYSVTHSQKRALNRNEFKEQAFESFRGNLFTHPAERRCELTEVSKHMTLRLTGHTADGDVDMELDAPANGWTHGQIAAHITFNKYECWDAYLGDAWVGSSEI